MLLLLVPGVGMGGGQAAVLVTVPDVVGETQAAGTSTIEAEGLVVAVETAYSSTVPAGTIISQSPVGGSSVAPGSTVTITVSLGESAGGGVSKRKRRYFVQIDGQDFEVRGAEHAKQVLQHAVAVAEQAAERQVAVSRKRTKAGKVRKIEPRLPEIRTDAPIDLEPYERAIEQAYRKVAHIAELRLLLEAQARQEDEEAAAYLLLH